MMTGDYSDRGKRKDTSTQLQEQDATYAPCSWSEIIRAACSRAFKSPGRGMVHYAFRASETLFSLVFGSHDPTIVGISRLDLAATARQKGSMKEPTIVIRPAKPVYEEGVVFARFVDMAAQGQFRLLLGRRIVEILGAAFLVPDHDLSY